MNRLGFDYPVGIQTFERVIKEKKVYIDKTDLVWKLAHVSPYVFLGRPRRFGKSLLTTTLKSYFEGRRDLFDGLKIMGMEKDWKAYPVIHLDLSTTKNQGSLQELKDELSLILKPYRLLYGGDEEEKTPGAQLRGIITRAARGTQVVVLLDEYDAPLLDVLHDDARMEDYKRVMQEFFQPLKACEGMIRFCFITGITKFSQLSIFSTLNNISNLTMHPDFAAICGITEHELCTVMAPDIAMLAEHEGCTPAEMHQQLKSRYDGYHFSRDSEDVYNPYSLMNCFAQKEVSDFWFDSGTSSYLQKQMRRFNTDFTRLDNIVASSADFNLPTESLTNALPLLYQSGYLTIKGYDRISQAYMLGIPNQEVRVGIMRGLLPIYSGLSNRDVQLGCAYKMWRSLDAGDVEQAMRELQAFLTGVPYVSGFKKELAKASTREGFWEYSMYLIFSMMNIYVLTQVHCWGGRIDMVVFASAATYVIEFKIGGTARQALEQIDTHSYADPFATAPKPVVKVGVLFDLDAWNIKDWLISK